MSKTKNSEAKITSRSQGEFSPKQDIAWYLYWSFSLALPVSEHHPPSHCSYLFILFPSHFNDSCGNMRRPDTRPSALKSHKYRTPLVQHLITCYFTVSRPGATDPPVPSNRPSLLPCQFHCPLSRLSWQSGWLSMLPQGPVDKNDVKLNHVKPENLQCIWDNMRPLPFPHNEYEYQQTAEATIKGKYSEEVIDTLLSNLYSLITSAAFKVAETSPRTHFHLASIHVLPWGDPQAQHLNTCPTPLTSDKSRTPLVHHFIPCFSTVQKPGGLFYCGSPPVVKNCAKSIKQLYFLDALSVLIE